MDNIIIDIRNLSKSFGGKKVLKDINLSIRQGEFVTLLGPSGCGKTTLLRHIAGFLEPDEGSSISLEGSSLLGIPPYKRPLNTVFQRYALFPHLDVYDNVAFGLKLQKLPQEEIDKRVHKVLKLVSMDDYEDRDISTLSGGQQQRIAIARAIVNQPKVLLLDEPLAALDLKMRKDMQIELKEMHKKLGITFIYVTHDQEEALTLSDTIVVMDEGKILQIGTPKDIYNEPQNSFVANFIGESNILDATMIEDFKVNFMGRDFECVDKGFEPSEAVDVVVRPEDIYLLKNVDNAQFTGVVKSCTFKGVHYEMFIDTESGNEVMVQDYNEFEVGSTVGMLIKPEDIQVMKKYHTHNKFKGVMTSETTVSMLGGEFDCPAVEGVSKDDEVLVEVDFDNVELLDNVDDAQATGNIKNILYKGNHYYIKVRTSGGSVRLNTQDVWDRNDLVGIRIAPESMRITKA